MLENDTSLVEQVKLLYHQGKNHAEVLRWLAELEMSPIEMMIQISEALELDISETSCINGWWHDGTSELKDEDINFLLDIALAEKSQNADGSSTKQMA